MVDANSICDKHFLQYSRRGEGGECELVIGLDFGTSASKVVIQGPELPGSQAYAVEFGEFSHPSFPYLLPTRLWLHSNGLCSLKAQDKATFINDIKLELFSENGSFNSNNGPQKQGLSAEVTAVAYLALLLRYVRKWFLEKSIV